MSNSRIVLRGVMSCALAGVWFCRENEGMNRSCAAMRTMLTEAAPAGLRCHIERAPEADHQTTPMVALPSAFQRLYGVLARQ